MEAVVSHINVHDNIRLEILIRTCHSELYYAVLFVKDPIEFHFPVVRQKFVHIADIGCEHFLGGGFISQFQISETASGDQQNENRQQRAYPFYHSFSSSSVIFCLISTHLQIRSTQPSIPSVPVSTQIS